jgi:hypothetical protein
VTGRAPIGTREHAIQLMLNRHSACADHFDEQQIRGVCERDERDDEAPAIAPLSAVQVASELVRVEAVCTARRLGGQDVLQRANATLKRISLIPLTPEIIELVTDADTHRYAQWTQHCNPNQIGRRRAVQRYDTNATPT